MRLRTVMIFACGLAQLSLMPSVLQADEPPRLFVLSPTALATVKRRVAHADQRLVAAMKKLRAEADEALSAGPYSVTSGGVLPPSGDEHDYLSIGPYWWPDPEKDDGLPYIRRDGRVNPEFYEHDTVPRGKMCDAVETLALAYYLTGEEKYASHAARLLRAWFLDEETRMNPHLQYGQAIPGRCTGRGIGLIDTLSFIDLLDAVGMLAGSEAWSARDRELLEAWFRQFLHWMLESRYGRDEAATKNNHGTWYDAQIAAYALFTGREDVATRVLREAAGKRIARQIEPDGRQPHELARTKSFSYSVMNLRGMFTLAALAERVDVDLWSYESVDGRSIRKAIDYLAHYVDNKDAWQHEQIGGVKLAGLYPLLRWAAIAYEEPKYQAAIGRLKDFDPSDARTELLFPAP
jgi:hypothetical protein